MLKFYRLKSEFFEVEKTYSFHLFMYHHESDHRVVFLHAGSIFSKEKLEEWTDLNEKGAYFQLFYEDLGAFYTETGITKEQLMEENAFYFRMMELQESRLKKYEVKSKEKFLLKTTLIDAAKTNDFSSIIAKVRSEILCLPLHKSPFISIATEIVDKLFSRDIFPVRVAALSYLIAKQNKITDEEKLCEIVVAALLKDVGLILFKTNLLTDFPKLRGMDDYEKHPVISIYILSKIGFEIPKNVKRLVLEQHEQSNGSGYPRQKKEDYIDFSSFIINLVDQILMYSMGKINGRKLDLIKTFELFHKGVSSDGINVNFPQRLLESLGSFLQNELEKEMESKS